MWIDISMVQVLEEPGIKLLFFCGRDMREIFTASETFELGQDKKKIGLGRE